MKHALFTSRAFFVSFALALAACGTSSPAPTPDAQADVPPSDTPATDVPVADAPADGRTFTCPAQSFDPLFSQPCTGNDGAECRYGYNVPGCGGRTWTCSAGRWSEVHTDPSASCFDGGRDAQPD